MSNQTEYSPQVNRAIESALIEWLPDDRLRDARRAVVDAESKVQRAEADLAIARAELDHALVVLGIVEAGRWLPEYDEPPYGRH